MEINEEMMRGLVQVYLWPFLRIGALLLAAPVFNAQGVAPRARLMVALGLTVVLAPLLPKTPTMAPFSAAWWLSLGCELAIGISIGFMLQLVFEGVMLAGELISYGMGLGFAQLADPLHGAPAPMLGQFYQICAMLLFLSLGGHLRIVELLNDSFRAAPPGAAVLAPGSFYAVAQLGGLCFAGALRIALPAVIALLLVNLSFGVMNRSAPALNALSLGFPLSLIVGLVALRFALPQLQSVLTDLLDQAWGYAGNWIAGLH
jgi:flagellar biosynthetic protein FliR